MSVSCVNKVVLNEQENKPMCFLFGPACMLLLVKHWQLFESVNVK